MCSLCDCAPPFCSDFPDHRIGFYKLLDAVNTHTFAALFSIPVTHQKLVIQAIMWGVRHSEPKICELVCGWLPLGLSLSLW